MEKPRIVMRSKRSGYVGILAAGILLVVGACAPPTATPQPSATATVSLPGPTVADLLKNPPAAGQRVEVDAYFSGATAASMPGPPPLPDQVACPLAWSAALTDRPFLADLLVLNGIRGNRLPDDAPWLIAASPQAIQPGRNEDAQLPYLARLRGYLGEPAFHDCDHADRIFVVEQVVTVYQQQPPTPPLNQVQAPADLTHWPLYRNADFGYSLPLPAGWVVEPQKASGEVLSEVALRGPRWPAYPLLIRIHAGPLTYDPYDLAHLPALMQGSGFGVFEQAFVFADSSPPGGGLAGFEVDRAVAPGNLPRCSAYSNARSQRLYWSMAGGTLGFGMGLPSLPACS